MDSPGPEPGPAPIRTTRLLDEIPALRASAEHDSIVVRGARTHNLRGIDVTLPRNRLVVITGPSGSGKSSLAFDTLYAEGQRRYVESLSSYARQFLDQLEKPDVDSIEGLSPALAIEQRSLGRSPRSTVGTTTEIADYLRLLYARTGEPDCPGCGAPIARQTVTQMIDRVLGLAEGTRVQVLAPLVRGRRGAYRKELEDLQRRGYVQARIDGEIRDLSEDVKLDRHKHHDIEAVIDRLIVRERVRARLGASLESALELADGLAILLVERSDSGGSDEWLLSRTSACVTCGISFPEIAPRMFSFNNPAGACPACSGLGSRQRFDAGRVVPDADAPLRDAIAPWQAKRHARYYAQVLADVARHFEVALDTPWCQLPIAVQRAVLEGIDEPIAFSVGVEPTRTGRARTNRIRRPWAGVLDDLERREDTKLERYQTSATCSDCNGSRLRVEARHVRVGGVAIHELCARTIGEVRRFLASVVVSGAARREAADRVLAEIGERLAFLVDVGLEYLTLDRPTASLSGGEAQRIRLATQIGSSLLGVLYILDEPSIGLHARDNHLLLASLAKLRDAGNSVVVVEHDEATIRAADHVIDMGPGAGIHGGEVVASGTPSDLAEDSRSPTGAWLAGRHAIAVPARRRVASEFITLRGARSHNLKDLELVLPLGVLTVVTGVSGSGKSTLINDTLQRALAARLHGALEVPGEFDSLEGADRIDKVIDVDQSPIGRTPRSNPATYTGAFDGIRQLFAHVPEARARGYDAGRFSFNVPGGRCEACEGAGQIRVEMHFLPDLFVACEICGGRRYERETLEITYRGRNIADVLEMTVEEALALLTNVPKVRRPLEALHDVGLDYLRVGQPATTLSGGEAQRVKLARELARRGTGRTLYLLDEPTTGLHLSDVARLVDLLVRLVERGNTVVVIEHHLDVIKCADHVIDLGPDGGAAGGEIVIAGTPERVAAESRSHTGAYLAPLLSLVR